MQTIGDFFGFLDQSMPVSLLFLVLFIFIFKKFHGVDLKLNSMSKDISQIVKDLGNHITDTNKKIDNQTARFDDLYKLLLKDKIENK